MYPCADAKILSAGSGWGSEGYRCCRGGRGQRHIFGYFYHGNLRNLNFQGECGPLKIRALNPEKKKLKHSNIKKKNCSATQWLKSSDPHKTEKEGWRHKLTWTYIRNNLRKILFVVLFAVIQLIITIYTVMAVLRKGLTDPVFIVIRMCKLNILLDLCSTLIYKWFFC